MNLDFHLELLMSIREMLIIVDLLNSVVYTNTIALQTRYITNGASKTNAVNKVRRLSLSSEEVSI